VYYNTGPVFPRRQLSKGRGLGFKRPWGGPGDHGNWNARYNALLRMHTLRVVENLGVFE
jgi:hypothetical protein